jgi:hypothetical protein
MSYLGQYAIGDRDRELSPRARDIVARLEWKMGIIHSFLPSTVGIRAIRTIEMNEKGIWWLLARVGGI